jgi:hypothetical protein
VACLLASRAGLADVEVPPPWAWSVTMSQWSAGLRGHIEPDAGTSALAAHLSDFLDHFEAGLALGVEARRGPWAVHFEPFYVDFDRAMPTPNQWVQIDSSQIQYGLAGAYRAVSTRTVALDAIVGARYNQLNTVLSAAGARTQSTVRSWVDPFVGARLKVTPGARWMWSLQGDVGGFNLGSRRTWSAGGQVGYRITRPTTLVVGYGVVATDYRATDGMRRVRYDVRIGGPSLGVTFGF